MSLTPSHVDNLVRWAPDQVAGAYESHFIKVNLVAERVAFWWKFTVLQPIGAAARFEVWAIAFDLADPSRTCAAKQAFGAEAATIDRDVLRCRYGANLLEHGASSGSLDSPRGPITWDLRWSPPVEGLRHFPSEVMYRASIPKTKLNSPTVDGRFDGTVSVGGLSYTLHQTPGMQGHNWGTKHADAWVWVHANVLHGGGAGAWFEAVSSRVKLGPFTTPQLTIVALNDGADDPLLINGPVAMARAESHMDGLRWRFRSGDGSRSVEGVFHAPAERFVGVDYHDPDGTVTHCLNSKIADGELRVLHRDRGIWRLRRTLEATASAALEIGTKGDPMGVRLHLT